MKPISHIIYWLGILLLGGGIVYYWIDVWNYENWYPIVGVFICTHIGLFGTIRHYVMTLRKMKDHEKGN